MRSPNKYIIFCKLYKKILDEESPETSPQEKVKLAGKFWNFIPNELKNKFEKYAQDEKILKNQLQVMRQSPDSGLPIIFDERVNIDHPITSISQSQSFTDENIQIASDLPDVSQPENEENEEEVIFNEMYYLYVDDKNVSTPLNS